MKNWIVGSIVILVICGLCILYSIRTTHARIVAEMQAKDKSMAVKDYEQDFVAARRYLQHNPNDPDAHLGLARYYSKQKDYYEAAKEAQQTLKLQPDNQEALYTEAHALSKSGQQADALLIWQRLAARHTPWGLKARPICRSNIHALRTLQENYQVQGLRTVAVHMPRGGEDTDIERVRQAALDLGIEEPCAVDNRHSIGERYETGGLWPYYFLFGRDGKMLRHAAGPVGLKLIGMVLKRIGESEPVGGAAA